MVGAAFTVLAVVLVFALVGLRHMRESAGLARAMNLSLIADDAAALVLFSHPRAQFANQVVMVQQQIASAAGLPVHDAKAIERAAAGALYRKGILPQ